MNHKSIMAFFFMVIISQLILPFFNKGEDFLFFTTWNLYAINPQERVFDLYCIEEKEASFYIFRDKAKKARKAGLNYNAFNKQAKSFLVSEISLSLKKNIYNFCGKNKVELHKVPLTFFEHFIEKKTILPSGVLTL